jgi:hypothetical protein
MTTRTFGIKGHIPRESYNASVLTGPVLKGSSQMVLVSVQGYREMFSKFIFVTLLVSLDFHFSVIKNATINCQKQFANYEFQVRAVFHLYPIFQKAVSGLMYPWLLPCTHSWLDTG